MKPMHHVIVIGAGVAGASAGMYSARFNLNTKVMATMPGGLITTTHSVENYPGIKSISGPEMGQVFVEHAMETGAQFHFSTAKKITAKTTEAGKLYYEVIDGQDKPHTSWTVIIATGTQHKHLGVPGEKEFANKGVSYCALCDAAFFKEKKVAVVGGGDSAAIEANILADHAAEVHVFVRKDTMRAEPVNIDRMNKNPKITVHFNTEVTEIKGEDKMTHIILKDGSKMNLDGIFIAIGWLPQSALAAELGVALDQRKMIIIDRYGQTNLPGIYACGDVTNAEFKQAIIGAAEGVSASYKAYKYMETNEMK